MLELLFSLTRRLGVGETGIVGSWASHTVFKILNCDGTTGLW